MRFNVITVVPGIIHSVVQYSILARSLSCGICTLNVVNLKDYGIGKHKVVDDYVYGGGAGLLLRADVLSEALERTIAHNPNQKIIYMSAKGKRATQSYIREIASPVNEITLICGKYEGVDQRFIDYYPIEEIRTVDFVLSGGELAALSIIEGIMRILPGSIKEYSSENDSLELDKKTGNILTEEPQYTRPRVWKNIEVPEILLSGHHNKIEQWKKDSRKILKD